MSNIFFTADIHFNHSNIVKYCNRPFDNIEEMNNKIIDSWNNTVKDDDIIYYVGDFCFKSKYKFWENKLNGKIIYFRGNHDRFVCLDSAVITFNNHKIFIRHKSIMNKCECPDFINFVISAHSHEKYKYKVVDDIIVINVGVDVWNFKPVTIERVINYYKNIRNEIRRVKIDVKKCKTFQ